MLASNPSAKPVAKIAGSNALLPAFVQMILARMRENAGVWGGAPVTATAHVPPLATSSSLRPLRSGLRSSVREVIYSPLNYGKSIFVTGVAFTATALSRHRTMVALTRSWTKLPAPTSARGKLLSW